MRPARRVVSSWAKDHPRLFSPARRAHRLVRRVQRHRHARILASRTATADARLVTAPVFVICSVRSGSTLLRVLLNTHPRIHAPHELHLRSLRVRHERRWSELATEELGLDHDELEHLLWDRLLHRELIRSGKQVIVDKTPGNCTFVDRLQSCWPDARFIILLRHPASVFASLLETRSDRQHDATLREALTYLNAVEEARQTLPGLEVRYEDLTADPAAETQRICTYLGVQWDPNMLEYGKANHGRFRAGIGDWKLKIRSGRIQRPRPLPALDEVPEELKALAAAWGYLP